MNLYAILGALILAGAALFGAERAGEHRGAALQSSIDQKALDKVHRDLEEQQAQAGKLMADAAARDAAEAQARAQLHQQQEISYANDRARTDAARRAGGDGRLRFSGTAVDSGGRPGRGNPMPAAGDAAGPTPTAAVELSAAASGALRDLMFECDQLADDYRALYRFNYPDWRPPIDPLAPTAASPPSS